MTYKLVFGAFYVSCFVFTSYINWKLNRERYNVFLNALEASDYDAVIIDLSADHRFETLSQ